MHGVVAPVDQAHPLVLEGYLPLAVWPISGETSDQEDFRRELSTSYIGHGIAPQSHHNPVHGGCGLAGVVGDQVLLVYHTVL